MFREAMGRKLSFCVAGGGIIEAPDKDYEKKHKNFWRKIAVFSGFRKKYEVSEKKPLTEMATLG
ncbi:hypothetical protein WH240_11055 [Gluconobacter wancherniae]|uniref:hypothetical protein n=1 Tax=Gluconobacter wancherniae TaxID=1307955 RepID=UPI003097E309